MALAAQAFDHHDRDDWKDNHDGGDESESDFSDDNEEKPHRKKVIFVRCAKCRDKKSMCPDCKKRQQREASQRNREKNARTKAALKRLKKENCVLNAKLQVYCENNEFIRQLISSGAIFCNGCSGQLVPLPASHAAPQPTLHAVVQQWDVDAQPQQTPHILPNYASRQHHQTGCPIAGNFMEPQRHEDPMFGAGALAMDPDNFVFQLHDEDNGNFW